MLRIAARAGAWACVVALAGCDGAVLGSGGYAPVDDAGDPIGEATGDLAMTPDAAGPADLAMSAPPDLAVPPPMDPCRCAALGDGTYCGANLKGCAADPNVLYDCKAKMSASQTACPHGCHLAPDGVPDYCEPGQPANKPKGKGVWVWMFNTTAPSPQQTAIEAQALGVGFVLIKSGQDTSWYQNNFNDGIVAEFVSRGIKVFGWPYVTAGNIGQKADVIAQQARVKGVSGIILDVEGEFVGAPGDASALCDGIRQRVPGVFLGYTSYGWVDYHLNFPYAQFDAHCGDAFLPQTYWDEWNTGPVGGLMKGREAYAAHGWHAPVWPVQDDYNGASVQGMNQYFDAAGPRASLWRWPNPADAAIRNTFGQLHWAN